MEYATKQVWGVLGEDPMKTEQELVYAREKIFHPFFDFIDESIKYAKNTAETTLGIDLDRDGAIGQIETNDPQGVALRTGSKPSTIIKASDSDMPLAKEPVKLAVNLAKPRGDDEG